MGKGERRAVFFGVTADLLLHPQAGFKRAVELVGSEFMDRLDYYHRAWLPARALVEDAIRRRFEVLPVLVLGGFKGWVEAWGKGRPGPLGVDLPTQLRAQLCTLFLSLHPYSHPLCTPVTLHCYIASHPPPPLSVHPEQVVVHPHSAGSHWEGGAVLFRW